MLLLLLPVVYFVVFIQVELDVESDKSRGEPLQVGTLE